jgi:hypothetical protein
VTVPQGTDGLSEAADRFAATLTSDQVDAIAARFPQYSRRNALLIAMQRPDATDVTTFPGWIVRGRVVRKGERGIKIVAPRLRPRSDEGADPQPEDDRLRVRFRVLHVFDVSQTDEPKPRPDG